MPDIQPHAVAAAEQEQKAQSNVRDNHGNIFNPDDHAVDSEGNPKLTKLGKFAKKRGVKKGSTHTAGGSMVAAPAKQTKAQEVAILAQSSAQMIFTVGRILGGEEWAPLIDEKNGVDESANMYAAFHAYWERKAEDEDELPEIHPALMIGFVLLCYAGPRFAMPKTKSRYLRAKLWVFKQYYKAVGRKEVVAEEKAEEK